MSVKIIDLEQIRALKALGFEWGGFSINDLPLSFSAEHCASTRAMLDWSVEALAFRSGVSVRAIQDLEDNRRPLRQITMQALSFALEAERPGFSSRNGTHARGKTAEVKPWILGLAMITI